MHRVCCFVLASLAVAAHASAAPPVSAKRLAVLTLTAPWTPDCQDATWRRDKLLVERCSVLETLVDEARSGAVSALRGRPFMVLTRENTALLLRENGRGGVCTEGECEVETARLIGVDEVVSGSVTLVEGTWFVTLKLHDVASANLLDTTKVKAATQVALIEAVQGAAEALVRRGLGLVAAERPQPTGPVSAAGPQEGTIDAQPQAILAAGVDEVVIAFESTPDGAAVLVDGQLLCKETPCRKRLAVGPHVASYQRERYAPAGQSFTAAKGAVVRATLAPRFGWVSVETTPPGVAVAIDGTEVGKSPIAWREVDEGNVEVVVSDGCFLRTGERVAVKAGGRRTVKLTARPRLAGLKVNAEDDEGNAVEADVTVDGVAAGPAGSTLKVPVCAKKVTVPLGRETFEGELRLEEGKVALVTAKPDPRASAGAMVRFERGTYTPGHLKEAITVGPFLLDVYEVSAARYDLCVKSGKCTAAATGGDCTPGVPEKANHPANCVDADQAADYCAWLGRRLPTEEEWEWAARGAERGTTYPWGNAEPSAQLCWSGPGNDTQARGFKATCPGGAYPKSDSPQGIKDLAGNVWEWTSSAANEAGKRITRGGGWFQTTTNFVAAAGLRGAWEVTKRDTNQGFRCAKTP